MVMKRVLAVDDNEDILFTLEAIGGVADFEMETVNSSKKALEKIKTEEYNLLIIDYYMPEMNGLELVEKIRSHDPGVPILVLTVDETLEVARRFIDAGATDFATKPIRAADLISRINLHLKLSNLQDDSLTPVYEEEVPKGMSPQTLQLVIESLNNAEAPQTIEDISGEVGLAYQTVHRYLIFLEQEGLIKAELDYRDVGRPIKKFSKKKELDDKRNEGKENL